MAVQHTFVPPGWRGVLLLARATLATLTAGLALTAPASRFKWVAAAVALATAAFALYFAARHFWRTDPLNPQQLGMDAVGFLIAASSPSQLGEAVSIGWFWFIILLVSLLYDKQVVAVAATAAIAVLAFCDIGSWDMWLALYCGALVCAVLAFQKRLVLDKLSQALRRSVEARSELELAREAERRRIAADFHDGPLQSFISFQMRLEFVRRLLERDPQKAAAELQELQKLGAAQVEELRSFAREMSPKEIYRAGLAASIRDTVERFARESGIETHFQIGDLPRAEGPEQALEVVQIVREALSNIKKHAAATHVELVAEAVDANLHLTITDNGKGFPFSGQFSLEQLEVEQRGPRSIRRRVAALGGELLLDTRPGHTRLQIRLPI